MFEKNTRGCEKTHLCFHRFFTENRRKKRCHFLQRRSFFRRWRPARNTVFTIRKLLFHFLSFCILSKKTSKNGSKIQPAFFPSKNTKKSSRGTRFGSQNGPELTSEGPKISKMVQKSSFLTVPFFEHFLRRKKSLRIVSARWAAAAS